MSAAESLEKEAASSMPVKVKKELIPWPKLVAGKRPICIDIDDKEDPRGEA